MDIVTENDIIKVVKDGAVIYTAHDMADAEQFVISYVEPVLPLIDTSDQDFIPAEGE